MTVEPYSVDKSASAGFFSSDLQWTLRSCCFGRDTGQRAGILARTGWKPVPQYAPPKLSRTHVFRAASWDFVEGIFFV
jgi:hypothetical protein